MKKKKLVVYSAIQPSGHLTIGHYVSVLKNWVSLQNHYKCFYCIADLHSLTNQKIRNNFNFDVLSIFLAIGIDPENAIIFLQSKIYEHTQLYWILNCHTNFSELKRMTQFKTKLKEGFENNNGLFTYPLLMAADILLYKSNIVPIGLDQIQHLELTNKIVNRFNRIYGTVFSNPKPLILEYGSKIMALLEPTKKMSKSDNNFKNVIFLLDDIRNIKIKILSSLTDSENPANITYNVQNKPGISNLLVLFSLLTNKDIKYLENEFKNSTYSTFKKQLIEILCDFLNNLQRKFLIYRKDELFLQEILNNGAKKAQIFAKKNLYEIYKSIGLN